MPGSQGEGAVECQRASARVLEHVSSSESYFPQQNSTEATRHLKERQHAKQVNIPTVSSLNCLKGIVQDSISPIPAQTVGEIHVTVVTMISSTKNHHGLQCVLNGWILNSSAF